MRSREVKADWFRRVFGVVFVLSAAVLVIVIDVSMGLRAGFGDTIELQQSRGLLVGL